MRKSTGARRLGLWCLAMVLVWGGAAALAQGQDAQVPLKEIQLAIGTFTRGAPVPAWAQLAPVPVFEGQNQGKATVVHLSDAHFQVGAQSSWLSNRVTQANDANALGPLGQVALRFNPTYQQLALHRLAILRQGQVIDHTNSVPVRFLQRETQLEQGVYNGVITASMVLPDVRVGDALHLVYSITGSNPIMGARFSEGASWEETQPVRHRRVTLVAPAERRIPWRWVGDSQEPLPPEPTAQVKNGVRQLVFEQRNIPGVDLEPMVPAHAQPLRWLQFSEYGSWSEVAQWAMELFAAPGPMPAELAPVLERLRGLPDDAVRASEALRWVQDNIRYHAVLLGESSHRPRPLAVVLRDRYGDCKDKTLLLIGMLRALGVSADPVLASLRSRRGMSGVLPSPDVFDHAVVRVRVAGVDYFVDPTRTGQVGALARMGQSLEDAEVLLVRADSQGATLVRSPLRAEIFQHSVTERFMLDAFGEDAQLQLQMMLNGLDAEALRAALPQMDEAQRRQSMLSGYEKRYPGLQLMAAPAFLDVPSDNQIRIVASYRIPNLAREVSGNWVMNFVPSNLRGSVFIPERITRRFPVLMPSYPGSVLYQVQMRWPESVAVVNDPRIRNVDSRFFRARIESSFRGREASRKVLFEALVPEVAARDLPTLIEDVRKLDREVTGVLVVGRDEIKRDGLLGIGRQSVMDKMRERLRLTVQGLPGPSAAADSQAWTWPKPCAPVLRRWRTWKRWPKGWSMPRLRSSRCRRRRAHGNAGPI